MNKYILINLYNLDTRSAILLCYIHITHIQIWITEMGFKKVEALSIQTHYKILHILNIVLFSLTLWKNKINNNDDNNNNNKNDELLKM